MTAPPPPEPPPPPSSPPAAPGPAATGGHPGNPQPPLALVGTIGHRLAANSAYVLVGFPLALISFVVIITGFSLGLGLLVTVIGIPVLTGTIYIARGFADVERLRAAPVLGRALPRPRYRKPKPGAGWFARMVSPLVDPQSWLDLVYPLFAFPIATVTWSIAISWWSVAISGVTYGGWYWLLPVGPDQTDLPELLGFSDSDQTRVAFYTLVGLFFAATLVPVLRGCALAQAHLTRTLLSGVAELQARIEGLRMEKADAEARTVTAQARTAAAVSAEATALRRLERDIHDGPQQRLVRLAMDLGRARHQLQTDDLAAARETVTEAITQTRETLDELRALSRGIAPPILVDRGLAAAIASLAGRSTVPVELRTTRLDPVPDQPSDESDIGRLSPGVESAAYFVIAESLTNVAKHSRATECLVALCRTEAAIVVTVSDNGVGGAHLAKGHGLAGLADRVNAAGGRLTVASPPPDHPGTVITAELPL